MNEPDASSNTLHQVERILAGQKPSKKKQNQMKPKSVQHQNKKDGVGYKNKQSQNGGGNNSKKKNKRKKAGNAAKKSERIVCIAEETLIPLIEKTRVLAKNGVDLVDLPKDQINNLPDVPYKVTKNAVVVICSAEASDGAVAEIRTELSPRQRRMAGNDNAHDGSFQYLGFDTETRPKFQKGGANNPPALIQLATQTTAYLFRLSHQGHTTAVMTDSLRDLLADEGIVKVGIGVHGDVNELNRVYDGCCGDGTSYLDLGPLARLRWPKIQRVGLRNLTATILRFKLSKAQQMKNWEGRLTPAMEAYAAADALVALDLLTA
eukprot:CAMPEP_0181104392 /NCGR_PEP_ID=MMETSP1071-20121207/15401_1 /TAXON_ID=35127 /ORGANISM="Thalassiosira sp., Strain NH16" /LENGTH=319 /DNA_ID=CAMNT_0023187583 /DNA_START=391 /DNA_END=1346 /DNA_ORIENTATION=-